MYNKRLHQVDLRLTREFRVQERVRLQGQFDLYNIAPVAIMSLEPVRLTSR